MLHGKGTGYSVEASAYYSWFSSFIYDSQTGAIEDGLPVFQFSQADARYYGFEVQASATLAQIGSTEIVADGLADYTHATIVDVGAAPRIPPLRLLGGLSAKIGQGRPARRSRMGSAAEPHFWQRDAD